MDVVNTYSITISQDLSIQVQSVWYKTQTGLIHAATILWQINAITQVAILLAINVKTDTGNQLINVLKGLNERKETDFWLLTFYFFTLGRRIDIQTNSQPGFDQQNHMATILWLINTPIQGAILIAIDVNTDTSNQIDQYQYSRHDLRSCVSMRTSITSNTVIKAESQSTEVYL